MSKIPFETAIEYVLAKEGGYTNDPDDDGNWTGGKQGLGELKGTKFGISAKAYPTMDIKNLTRKQSIEIYRRDYWNAINADKLPDALRLTVFDMAVNAGCRKAIQLLQQLAKIEQDGVPGPITVSQAQLVGLEAYSNARKAHYRAVVAASPKKLKFFKGWIKRTNEIEEITKRLLK